MRVHNTEHIFLSREESYNLWATKDLLVKILSETKVEETRRFADEALANIEMLLAICEDDEEP